MDDELCSNIAYSTSAQVSKRQPEMGPRFTGKLQSSSAIERKTFQHGSIRLRWATYWGLKTSPQRGFRKQYKKTSLRGARPGYPQSNRRARFHPAVLLLSVLEKLYLASHRARLVSVRQRLS